MSGKGEKGRKGEKRGRRGQKEEKSDVPATPKLKKLTNVKVEEGQKVTLKCELLAGGKQTKIEWYQNGIKIGKNETRKIKLKKKGALSELQLMKVTDADVGTYTCKAVNDRGEDTQIASVQVMKDDKVVALRCVDQRPVVLASVVVLLSRAAVGKKTLLAQSVMIFMLCSGVMEMPAAAMVVSSQISTDSNHDCG
ncbi:hypothetical protein PDJAM_G00083940 [Pangasius djambal]|uniref:Uncharacterized protein n=1 Tax=Pangasius djambal TaxID=1691987 RepID=A0ACC5Z3I9_9TELE|nr:hypothetical protein [Pangasius djambal]